MVRRTAAIQESSELSSLIDAVAELYSRLRDQQRLFEEFTEAATAAIAYGRPDDASWERLLRARQAIREAGR